MLLSDASGRCFWPMLLADDESFRDGVLHALMRLREGAISMAAKTPALPFDGVPEPRRGDSAELDRWRMRP